MQEPKYKMLVKIIFFGSVFGNASQKRKGTRKNVDRRIQIKTQRLCVSIEKCCVSAWLICYLYNKMY